MTSKGLLSLSVAVLMGVSLPAIANDYAVDYAAEKAKEAAKEAAQGIAEVAPDELTAPPNARAPEPASVIPQAIIPQTQDIVVTSPKAPSLSKTLEVPAGLVKQDPAAVSAPVVAPVQKAINEIKEPIKRIKPSKTLDNAQTFSATPRTAKAVSAPIVEKASGNNHAAKETFHNGFNTGTCATGRTQSPINIAQYAQADLSPIDFAYQNTVLDVENNGHTIQVNTMPGSAITVDGITYDLAQFHFHTPSEHYLDGAPYPMEMHLVHKADNGAIAVVGVMMKLGAHNVVIQKIWDNAPIHKGRKTSSAVEFTPKSLLPATSKYFAYDGSLTTPPCTEGLKWHVMQDPIEISQAQLKTFQTLFPMNARPLQDLEGRVVKGN